MGIVSEILNDGEKGAKHLFDEYGGRLTAAALALCGNETDANDLVLETVDTAVRKIGSYRNEAVLFEWLYGIMKNLYHHSRRRMSATNEIPSAELPDVSVEGPVDGSDQIVQAVDAGFLRDAVNALPPDMRAAVVLRYFMDLPLLQIAKFLSLPVGTVKSRLHYARLALTMRLGVKLKKSAVAMIAAGLMLLGAAFAAIVARPEPEKVIDPYDDSAFNQNMPIASPALKEDTEMNIRQTMTATFAVASLMATALDEPIYTVTTSGEGTNSLDTAIVEVTQNGETTTSAFSDLTLTTGTFRKRGPGFLVSSDGMGSFTGTILIEEGALIVSATPHLGPADTTAASVVISNGASLVTAVPEGLSSTWDVMFRSPITFEGDGYKGLGAISIQNKMQQTYLFRNTSWTMTGDATIGVSDVYSYAYYIDLQMNRHALTFRGIETGTGTFMMKYCKAAGYLSGVALLSGDIVVDGTSIWEIYKSSRGGLGGTSEQRIILKKNDVTGQAGRFIQGSDEDDGTPPIFARTLVLEDETILRLDYGAWRTTNTAAWGGPVVLMNGFGNLSSSLNRSMSLLGPVSGDGGLLAYTSKQVNLVNGANTFTGEVRINTGWSGEGELRLFADGALPEHGAGATLNDSSLTLADAGGSYHLPALTFNVQDGKTKTFGGDDTVGSVASIAKLGAGTLDVTVPMVVSGRAELKGGTLKLTRLCYSDAPGLLEEVQMYSGSVGTGTFYGGSGFPTTNLLTNEYSRVTSYPMLANITGKPDWSAYQFVRIKGYIWNRGTENVTWAWANCHTRYGKLLIDGTEVVKTATDWYYVCTNMFTLTPGSHTFEVRMCNTGYGTGGATTKGAQGVCNIGGTQTSISGFKGTWKDNFGLVCNTNGVMSLSVDDYSIPRNGGTTTWGEGGDGFLFTRTDKTPEQCAPATNTQFSTFVGSPGTTLSLNRWSAIEIPTLEGVMAVTGGDLIVQDSWSLCPDDVTDSALNVNGCLSFADGVALTWTDLALLSRKKEHTLATATGGIEGMPAFDGNARGNKGWHLVKVTENGVESLKLFWQLGTTVVIR